MKKPLSLLCVFLAFSALGVADTLTVTTFDQEFVNWADPHTARFEFPSAETHYTQATLHITLGCPGSPGDCDPWDRLAQLFVLVPTSDTTNIRYEIARFITPYDITGGGPGTCGWSWDVTDYQTLLHDSVTLSLYITTWIGGNRGWLVTATFELVEGQADSEPYRVESLWDIGYLVFGDPDNPPADHITPVTLTSDPFTTYIVVHTFCTGHGQGNTGNAAEFSNFWHRLWVGAQDYQHQLWRSDCESNPCSPQGGTWQYDRAGWCPGSGVPSWDNIYGDFAGGDLVDFSYEIQPYENFCRPNNPECVDGQTCTDCEYNSTGHTEPNYCLSATAVFYRDAPNAVSPDANALPSEFSLAQNYPNPFNPQTTIRFSVPTAGLVLLTVYDLSGREITRPVDRRLNAGSYEIPFDASTLPSGMYFYSLFASGQTAARKMLLLK